MTVHMRHALPRGFSILHRDVESFGFVNALESPLDARNGEEEVADFVLGEVGEMRLAAERRDEDVSRQKRFEVYERE